MKSISLQKKFMLIVGGSIALMLLITAFFLVNTVADNTRSRVEKEVTALVAREANDVEGFFATYGGVARAFLSSPFFQDFFEQHTQRGASESQLSDAKTIYTLFDNISSADPVIKSAFFGSAITGEYFYEEGRVGVDTSGPDAGNPNAGYFATKRPWFTTAVEKGKLYVTPPAVDSQDGSISAVVQTPIFRNGKLLGVGGVDILISTVGKVIDSIRYEGQGTAFLLDDNQNIVYFPKQSSDLPLSSPISDFDKVFSESEGFRALAADIAQKPSGIVPVTWKGEAYFVVFEHAKINSPEMNWSLGILVPASVINSPINTAMTMATVVALVIIGVIVLITYIASAKVTQPLVKMRNAMSEIANGDGDLTKRLEVSSNDEIGALAVEFNRFTDKLRVILRETAANTRMVAEAAVHLRDVSQSTSKEINQERSQVDNVSTAVTEMAATVVEISKNAAQSSEAATNADTLVQSGSAQVQEAVVEIRALAAAIDEGVEVVSGLSKESDNIGAVIDVINSIAEQTNLLALNAAIEAARAGEQGRGFAVVADEVRSLASRTQESTTDIRRMVERLQHMAEQTDGVMQQGKMRSETGLEKTEKVVLTLQDITQSIGLVQEQSTHIALATEQQTEVAHDINKSLVAITGLSDRTSQHAEELAVEATQLSSVSSELKEIVSQFKI
ncbi:methyl-accepting chemotaxis protein [Alteromonas sp. McT4-15]|uniref:methyl-accepting chemotaxis protein n=1 Tax=Alteromonas sp. McT4-15 TaxID=2881256 RepID=UPI001CF858FB|nr:methyl-accepting chemotaxis protein [Alteromonas sp. McT4-15]MCB4435292.1 methyl-accepting chemotaxis protein [Alteromonas sp. McT4-15]